MGIIDAIILGVVEGLSEFLPISSTGHLILASHLLGLPPDNFVKSFEVAIQCGAILAVVILYWRDLLVHREVMARILTAFIPTGIVGFVLYRLIKTYLLGSTTVVLWSLALGGVALILFEYSYRDKCATVESMENISYRQAFVIGLFQSLAVIPGVSRAAATIVGGLVMGLSRKTIVEFSFVLAVPTMLAATGYDLLKNASRFSVSELTGLAVGFMVSLLVAWLAIRFFLKFIQTHTFIPFGIYRIGVSLLWVLLVTT